MENEVIRVLVVEDCEDDFILIREMLTRTEWMKFSVTWAPSYNTGIGQLRTPACDVALIDYRLDGRNGIEFIREAHALGCTIPFIIMTGLDDPALVNQALSAGAADYFVKGDRNQSALCRSIHYVTLRQAADKTHREERQLLRSVIETIPDRIYVKDVEGRYVIDNASHRRFIGVKGIENVVGKTVYDFFEPTIAAQFEGDDQALIRSGLPLLEREERTVDVQGRESWMRTAKVPLRDAAGKAVGVLGVSRDITESKRADGEREQINSALREALNDLRVSHEELKATQLILIQTEKLESLGRLAAGVAHEVKNPLAQIMLAADFLKDSVPAQDTVSQTVLGDIRQAVTRADKIIRGMLDFSAPNELCLRPQNINATLRQLVRLLKSELLTAHVEVRIALGEALPPVEIDENKIEQVFINVCTNAIHAMPQGGVLEITTCVRELGEGGRRAGTRTTERLHAGDRVVSVEFCDTGHGIPPDKVTAVFDPFFTTKPTGKGTGLGLTVSRKIVELHGGRLDLENRPEGGARASVIFPISRIEHLPEAHSSEP